jgi:hypothetical protein
MGLRVGIQERNKCRDLNEEYKQIPGDLEDDEAKVTLAKFLYHNLRFTTYILTGIRLAPYQTLMIKSWFQRNFCLNVWGRGCAKSTLAGLFAVLYCIFNPGAHVLIVSSNFRSSRRILENVEKLAKRDKGVLLRQCFDGDMSRRNDVFQWKLLNGSSVTCVPLSNGEGLRGLRANVLIVDEALLVSKEIITTILMPFLVASSGIEENMAYREKEDQMIAEGKMDIKDRRVFKSTSKLILLSSASYKFEYLYEVYEDYLKKIEGKLSDEERKKEEEKQKNKETVEGSYLVTQLSYRVVPDDLLDKAILAEATGGTTSEQTVLREYEAQFVDGSEGYFSPAKMEKCTIPDGHEPSSEVVGEKGAQYILGIDPSMSSSESSDHFAMSVLKIVEDENNKEKKGLLVHSYAVAGGDLKDHILYLLYLLDAFNIVYIVCDTTQGDSFDFISAANESELCKLARVELRGIEADFAKDDRVEMLKQIKKSYNFEGKRIVQKQSFNSTFIRSSNEFLQTCIDYQKVLFASRSSQIRGKVSGMTDPRLTKVLGIHREFKGEKEGNSIYDFVEYQDDLIKLTKKECALIEMKNTQMGSISFDLPQNIKRSSSPTRPRKDNYSSLLLANWGLKLFVESQNLQVERPQSGFEPEMF